MHKFDENYIFDKVRITLEEYQPECSSNDWSKMSVMLDKQVPMAKPSRGKDLIIGFIAGVIVSLSFIGTLYYSQGEKVSSSQETSATNVAINNNIKLNEQPIFLNSKPKYLTIEDERVQIPVVSSVADVSTIDISELPEDNYNSINRQVDFENAKSESLSNSFQPLDEDQVFSKKLLRIALDIRKYNKIKPDRLEGIHFSERPSMERKHKSESKSKLITINWDLFKGSFRFQDDMYKRFVGPDRIRFGYMPELTFGNFQDKSAIGHGFGIELEGPISKRVLIGIGLNVRNYNWSKEQKFKSLQMSEFPDTSYHYVVDSIHQWKGNWRYFEIPLSLKLHFMEVGKSKIFFNAYLAAILMQSESYEYNRIISTDKYSLKNKPAPFTNMEVFGNVRVGLEYRYFINRRWNFYFEPYYKWSLTGMGEKEIRPKSFGINFGLIYQFNLHE